MEAYVQETGRAGRDEEQSIVYILYHVILLNHVEGQMKSFVKTSECRRQALMRHFDSALMQPEKAHLCCDNQDWTLALGECQKCWASANHRSLARLASAIFHRQEN